MKTLIHLAFVFLVTKGLELDTGISLYQNVHPCQYLYNNSWYSLIRSETNNKAFKASNESGDEIAYYTFC